MFLVPHEHHRVSQDVLFVARYGCWKFLKVSLFEKKIRTTPHVSRKRIKVSVRALVSTKESKENGEATLPVL